MNARLCMTICVMACISLLGIATAENVIDEIVNTAMKELPFEKGNHNILIMTNIGYAQGSEMYLDDFLSKVSELELSVSKNVIFVHNSYNKPLWFAFFDKLTGNCIYIEIKDGRIVKQAKENIAASNLLSNPEDWDAKMKSKVFSGNEFSVMTIANVWAKGMPWELQKSAEFHNHICPGLTAGYLIAQYLKKELPLESGEEYQILAVPPWCKDDALQVIFDSTVGKRKMVVKTLSKEQTNALPENMKNIAGIYIRWDRNKGEGKGIILTFDWNKACKDAGINRSDFKDFKSYKWWYARLKVDLWMMDYLDKPEYLISKVKEFRIDSNTLNKIKTAGVNPLIELGVIVEKPSKTEENKVEEKKSPLPFEVGVIGLVVAAVIFSILKRKS